MRWVAILVVLAMAGCVSNGTGVPLGKHAKNGGPVRVERMGTMMTLAANKSATCHSEQVLLCRGEAEEGDCRCLFIRDAERSLQRVTHDRQGFRTSGHRH